MKKNQSSVTAAGIAAARAVESLKPEGERICYDPYARQFLGPVFFRIFRFFMDTGYAERRGPGVNEFLVARCRYMDDFLQTCLDDGLQQLVILGAGYDSRAYRFAKLPGQASVFEVDHPATQRLKIEKVRKIFGKLPAHVTYAGIDFAVDTLEKRLPECGYDGRLKTLFIWEGVTMYLSAEAIDSTLAFVARRSGPGSAIIFDYIYTSLLDGTIRHGEISQMRRYRRLWGEALTFGIAEGAVTGFLHQRGFGQVTDATQDVLRRAYFTGVNEKRSTTSGYAIASAVIQSR